jgi:hypothetical protein
MSKLWKLMGVAALATGVATAAQAGPLSSASFSVALAGATLVFPGVGATGTAAVGGNGPATIGAGSAFAGTQTVTLTGTQATKSPVDKIQVVIGSNAAGSFTGSPLGGTATFNGNANLYATASASSPFLAIPANFGFSTSFTVMGSGLSFSIVGNPWTAGVTTVTGITGQMTPNGGSNGTTLMLSGMNNLTVGGGGSLTLVSPGRVYVSTGNKLPVIGTLVLNYVPEPGTLLLLGSGALGLAILGRRRAA